MVSEIIDSINSIDLMCCENAVDTLLAIGSNYDKMCMIMESTTPDGICNYNIFNDTDMFYQEGKIGDEIKKQNEGHGTINKILFFIPRLVVAIWNVITRKNKTSEEKASKIEKGSSDNSSNGGDASSSESANTLSSIWGKNGNVLKTIAKIAGGIGIGIAAGFVLSKGITKFTGWLKNKKHDKLVKILTDLGVGDEYNQIYEKIEQVLSLSNDKGECKILSITPNSLSEDDKKLWCEYVICESVIIYTKDIASLERKLLTSGKAGKYKSDLEKSLEETDNRLKEITEDKDYKDLINKLKTKKIKIPSDNEIRNMKLKAIDDNGDANMTTKQKDFFKKCKQTIQKIDSSVLQASSGKYPYDLVRNHVSEYRANNENLDKVQSGLLYVYNDGKGKVSLRTYVNIFEATQKHMNYLNEICKSIQGKSNTASANQKQIDLKALLVTKCENTIKEILNSLKISDNKNLPVIDQLKKTQSFVADRDLNIKMNSLNGELAKYIGTDSSDNGIIGIVKQFNDMNKSIVNLLSDIHELINQTIDVMYEVYGTHQINLLQVEKNGALKTQVSGGFIERKDKTLGDTTEASDRSKKYFKDADKEINIP